MAPGGTVRYTITATNSWFGGLYRRHPDGPAERILDDATYNGDAAATAGTVTFSSPNLSGTGNLAVGAVATITYSATAENPILATAC